MQYLLLQPLHVQSRGNVHTKVKATQRAVLQWAGARHVTSQPTHTLATRNECDVPASISLWPVTKY